MGTRPEDIDRAEDRDKFSAMLDSIGVDQPEWSALTSIDEAISFAARVSTQQTKNKQTDIFPWVGCSTLLLLARNQYSPASWCCSCYELSAERLLML